MKRFVDCGCFSTHNTDCPNYVSLAERRAFYASAMSTGTAKTPQAVEGRSPASAAPSGETPTTSHDGEQETAQ